LAKPGTVFICQQCGASYPKWMGHCNDCGSWNSLVEEQVDSGAGKTSGWGGSSAGAAEPTPFTELGTESEDRVSTGIHGLDRVLGGGMVPGSLTLVAGEPGAGKSTLMLQAASSVAAAGRRVLYVSGEESGAQVKMRGRRLGVDAGGLYVHGETLLDRIISAFEKLGPQMLVVDSVQTVYSGRFTSAPGSVSQVREAAARLLLLAKASQAPVFIVGHVTKGGLIAGPKTMEHIVDTVVMMEGERFQSLRILRAIKNRFGPVSELSVFEMTAQGLREVENPSELFLAERRHGIAGSAVTAAVEGTRPLLIEVQALVSPAAYGPGRRTAEGFDHNRLALLLAVLERRCGLELGARDVFVNIVGGVRLDEPAVDLAVAAAVASSLLDTPLPEGAVFIGEIGLGGEVRSASSAELRLREAEAMGMTDLYLPKRSAAKMKDKTKVKLHPVDSLQRLLDSIFRL
jgi:DNA repair protein RadA/Sms